MVVKKLGTNSLSNKTRLLIKVFVGIFLFILVIQLWVVNYLATHGNKLGQLQRLQSSLEVENRYLENIISLRSSLSFIEKLSQELGFEPIKKIEYIDSKNFTK